MASSSGREHKTATFFHSSSQEDALHHVLAEYKELSNSDAFALFNEIPPEEVWRFFVDRERQSIGHQFKKALEAKGLSAEDFELHPREFMRIHEVASTPYKLFIKDVIRRIPTEIYDAMKMKDLFHNENGWISFEQKEPGYLRAMIPQLNTILSERISLDSSEEDFAVNLVKHIKEIHQSVTQDVKNLIQDDDDEDEDEIKSEEKISSFRDNNFISCGLIDSKFLGVNNTTSLGFFELLNKMETQKAPSCFYTIELTDPNEENQSVFIIANEEDKKDYFFTENSTADTQFLLLRDLKKEDRHSIYEKYIAGSLSANQTCVTRNQTSIACSKALEKQLLQFARQFHAHLRQSLPPLAKLKLILTFIQECELTHPFLDANTRTFSMVLLNQLLVSNGFPPALHWGPMRSRAYSIDEQIDLLIKAMQSTLDLAKNKTLLLEVPTATLLENILKPSDKEYFREIVQMEVARRTVPLKKGVST